MLASLPKLAEKAFVLGFLLPALLFAFALIALFSDQPWTTELIAALLEKDGLEKLVYVVVSVWGFSVLMMMVNHTEFQILEGYLWPTAKMPWLKRAEERRFATKKQRFGELNDDWKREGDNFPEDKQSEIAELRRDLVHHFPLDPKDHLPTRFGNAIRAFEVYSKEIYGADSIPLWLHLSAVVPKEFQAALDDARAQVNCVVNICFFAAVIGLTAAARFLWSIEWSAFGAQPNWCCAADLFQPASGWLFAAAVLALAISRAAYLFAIELVYAWGDLVKSAFDCFLSALAEKLGYKLPETGEERKKFWRAVSEQAIYWRPLKPEDWPPATRKPASGGGDK